VGIVIERRTSLLIVGAGPFGLAMAAYARHLGIEHVVVGKPMEFWEEHMPEGMLLRSGVDWHLDPLGEDTIEAYLSERGLGPAGVEPLSLQLYLDYARWFQARKPIVPLPAFVDGLDLARESRFVARLADGGAVWCDYVLLAVGFGMFANVPGELAALVPPDRYSHTCDCVDLAGFRRRRCLVIGGRQSAFEWAALLRERGAAAVHVSYRHDTPTFAPSDWSWVDPLLEKMVEEPGWYRGLPAADRDEIDTRFWKEGRLKLEPWLAPRVSDPSIRLWPRTTVVACEEGAEGALTVGFDDGREVEVDHVILATGYRVEMARIPFLSGALRAGLRVADGFPVLDTHLQTSVPGLYVTSLAATRSFGLFFGFTSAVRASAKIVGDALCRSAGSGPGG
jgi:cation diffusion facilitator CzcD-associated flavoprotein CzcO